MNTPTNINTAYNMRFGAMAAEARNNGSADLKVSCAAKRLVEAATAPSRFLVGCKAGESAVDKDRKYSRNCE